MKKLIFVISMSLVPSSAFAEEHSVEDFVKETVPRTFMPASLEDHLGLYEQEHLSNLNLKITANSDLTADHFIFLSKDPKSKKINAYELIYSIRSNDPETTCQVHTTMFFENPITEAEFGLSANGKFNQYLHIAKGFRITIGKNAVLADGHPEENSSLFYFNDRHRAVNKATLLGPDDLVSLKCFHSNDPERRAINLRNKTLAELKKYIGQAFKIEARKTSTPYTQNPAASLLNSSDKKPSMTTERLLMDATTKTSVGAI